MDEKRLLEVAAQWARDTVDDWICEYLAWDNLIEDGTLTDEEYDWIRENVKFSISAENINQQEESKYE